MQLHVTENFVTIRNFMLNYINILLQFCNFKMHLMEIQFFNNIYYLYYFIYLFYYYYIYYFYNISETQLLFSIFEKRIS